MGWRFRAAVTRAVTLKGVADSASSRTGAVPASVPGDHADVGSLVFSPGADAGTAGSEPRVDGADEPVPAHTLTASGGSRFREVIAEGRGELLLFALTPPRRSTEPEKLPEISARTLGRLRSLSLDALLLYDLADESARTDAERPFPFSETWDPAAYLRDHLQGWTGESIVYRAVGKYAPEELDRFLREADHRISTVFVGAASREQQVRTSLRQAYELYRNAGVDVPLGAVAIPERHHDGGYGEHARLFSKQESGVSFHVSQVVYDLRIAKDLASDYAYGMRERYPGRPLRPLIFTLSVCGSPKSLEFLEWLGVGVPRWVRNELLHSEDPLGVSASYSAAAARELIRFCRYLDIPFGFSIESVSNRRVEIEASVALAGEVARQLDRAPHPSRRR